MSGLSIICFFKEFIFVSFDQETAATLGISRLYELLLYFSFGLAISVSIKLAGVLFVFAALIIPGMISLSLFNRSSRIFAASVGFGVFSCFWGIFLSFQWDLPTGPTVVGMLGGLFFLVKSLKAFFPE